MKKISLIIFILGVLTASCKNESSNSLSEASIDAIIETILDSTRVYDITESLNFSNDTEQYSVVSYSENDSTILFVESFADAEKEYSRQLYFNNGEIIFIKELGYRFNKDGINEEYEQNIYILGNENTKCYEKILSTEDSKLVEIDLSIKDYNFSKPVDAIEQNGDFELKFGEFLTIEPQTYLILENKKSNYNIALYILEGDFLLDELYTYPEKYKGKTIFANHENINMGGVMRMVYRGGILIEN